MKKLFGISLMILLLIIAVPLSVSAATSVSPSGGSGSGTLNDSTKDKEFSVRLSSAGRLTVNINAGLDLDFIIYDGTSSSYKDYEYKNVYKGNESLSYDLIPGTYTLKFSRGYGKSGNFSFTTAFTSANETYTGENGTINAVRNGGAVPFNKTINGQIAWNDKEDFYKVVLPSSGRLNLSVHNNIDKIQIIFYDSNEDYESVDGSMAKGDKSYTYDLVAGTYFFKFSRYSSSYTGTYNFKMNFVPSGETYTYENNTINAVRGRAAIPLAKTIYGQIAYNDREDYFKLVIPKKANYYIALNSNIEKVEMDLYDAKENTVNDKNGLYYYYHVRGKKTYIYPLKKGTYYLRIRRYSYDNTGTYNFKVGVSVPKTKITKLTSARKAAKVSWKKVSGASGYEIQYSTKSNFKKAKKLVVKKGSAKTKKIKKLKSKKKYYVRVRAYKVVQGKTYYSKWSAKKSIKTK